MAYIYSLICPKQNQVRYVGQTTRSLTKRLASHVAELNRRIKTDKRLSHKDNWLKQLKLENLLSQVTITLIEECSISALDEREMFWIAKYKKTSPLTNIQEGGQKHHKHSIETKQKISIANAGSNNGMFGKRYKRNKKQIKKIRDAMVASDKFQMSRKSIEYRKKISDLQTRPVMLLNEQLEVVLEFKGCTACAEYFGYTRGNIKSAVRNLRQIGKGSPTKFWIVRKDRLTLSIQEIKEKINVQKIS